MVNGFLCVLIELKMLSNVLCLNKISTFVIHLSLAYLANNIRLTLTPLSPVSDLALT